MEQQQCQNCGQKHDCQQIYSRLGKSKAQKVLSKVIQAFLLPLILFTVSIAVTEKLLTDKLKSRGLINIIALASAVLVIFLYLMILKFWSRKTKDV